MAPTKSTVPAEVGPSSHSHSLSPQLPPSSSFVYSQNQRPPYLASLSDTQFAAATYGASKSLQILAGPGSGKTRVLTSRVAWLILDPGNSLQPEDVVVVTFTNKAASEMKKRLDVLVGPERTARLIIGTFHATCARYLRKYGQLIDLRNNFSIMDADDR
ncbi:UvrD-helicase-domain-containing protein [Violaceomyces palustris]|uniref:UvrD-helicase-domain-containing protein n=1 Tax=Violaceomyces palustris TaxID=1673888 RepID=A0ACD0NUW7_9BASI|nr:UvrD-helicase-domain-containing protein [Violaceomyces palustris]